MRWNNERQYISCCGKHFLQLMSVKYYIVVICHSLKIQSRKQNFFNRFWDLSDFNKHNAYIFVGIKSIHVKNRYHSKNKMPPSNKIPSFIEWRLMEDPVVYANNLSWICTASKLQEKSQQCSKGNNFNNSDPSCWQKWKTR